MRGISGQQTERTRNLVDFFPWALGLLEEGAGSSVVGDDEGRGAEKSPELPKKALSRVDLKKVLPRLEVYRNIVNKFY